MNIFNSVEGLLCTTGIVITPFMSSTDKEDEVQKDYVTSLNHILLVGLRSTSLSSQKFPFKYSHFGYFVRNLLRTHIIIECFWLRGRETEEVTVSGPRGSRDQASPFAFVLGSWVKGRSSASSLVQTGPINPYLKW